MDKRIRELCNDAILAEALARHGIAREDARLLDGFESYIYACRRGGERCVLRVSHSLHRTADLIRGEVEWVDHLAGHGVPVARPLPSAEGNLVEPIPVEDGSHFSAAAFAWARGHPPKPADWVTGLPFKLGRIVGRMHALARAYEPRDPRFRRHEWHADYPEGFAAGYLPASDGVVVEKLDQLLATLHALPKDRDSYGLIHVDVHAGNFFVEGGEVTLFDFDDCQYAWFAYDVAMALFYTLPHDCVQEEDLRKADRFLRRFLMGYREENEIGVEWIERIPLFLKLREIDLYVIIHRSLDLDSLDSWCASFMANRRTKIANDVPYVELDWESYS